MNKNRKVEIEKKKRVPGYQPPKEKIEQSSPLRKKEMIFPKEEKIEKPSKPNTDHLRPDEIQKIF